MAWNAEKTKLYGVTNASNQYAYLLTTYPITGESTQVARISGHTTNTYIRSLTIDENNICYMATYGEIVSVLYECDLSTGKVTFLGSQSTAPNIFDISTSCDGNIYAVDYETQNLYKYDMTTWQLSIVGSLNLGPGFTSTRLSFDRKNKILYQFVQNPNGNQIALAQINTDSGVATVDSNSFFPGGYYYSVGAIKFSCTDESEEDPFYITERLNGSWYNSETSG